MSAGSPSGRICNPHPQQTIERVKQRLDDMDETVSRHTSPQHCDAFGVFATLVPLNVLRTIRNAEASTGFSFLRRTKGVADPAAKGGASETMYCGPKGLAQPRKDQRHMSCRVVLRAVRDPDGFDFSRLFQKLGAFGIGPVACVAVVDPSAL